MRSRSHVLRVYALLHALVFAGCPSSPTSVTCTTEDECPEGQHCRDGVCAQDCSVDAECSDAEVCTPAGRCGVPVDGGADDGGVGDASGSCRNAADCDDGVYCNGAETCAPDAGGVDGRGCLAGPPPCIDGAECDEATDICASSCDEDRDGNGRLDADNDGDGHRSIACGPSGAIPGDDCDDGDADRYPRTLAEICDPFAPTHDEDCNPCTVASYVASDGDRDGDGYYDAACANELAPESDPLTFECPITVMGLVTIDRESGVVTGTDCDDTPGTGAGVYPTQAELCNGVNDDCDAAVDEMVSETVYVDCDGDGWGESGEGVTGCHTAPLPSDLSCPGGQYVRARMLSMEGSPVFDCNGGDANINPMAADGCPLDDGIDNDCDGRTDEAGSETVYPDCDLDSWPRNASSRAGCHGNALSEAQRTALGCAVGARWLRAGSVFDCDDTRGAVYPTAPESCNSVNDDCDAATDEGTRSSLYYDADGDGYGAGSITSVCTGTAGYVSNNSDCNDTPGTGATIHPGQPEICDRAAVDHNCSGTNDEGLVNRCRDLDADGHGAGAVTSVCPTESGWINDCGGDCDESSSYRTSRWRNVTAAPDIDNDRYCDSGATTYCVGAGGPQYTGGWLGVPVRTDCVSYSDCAPFNAVVPSPTRPTCAPYTPTTSATWGCSCVGCPLFCPPPCVHDPTMTCDMGWRPAGCYRTITSGGGYCTSSELSRPSSNSITCRLTQTCNGLEATNCYARTTCEPCLNASCS